MTILKSRSNLPFQLLFFLSFSTTLLSEPVDSRITAVTVYSDRAIVTRTYSSELTVGEHVLTFENLPAALLDQSLQASGRGVASATILDVSAKNVVSETSPNERIKALEEEIKGLARQRRVLDDR